MMFIEGVAQPLKHWLAAAPTHSGNDPHEHADRIVGEGQSLRVLIVEDEFFISLDTKALLEALGHTVVGIAVSADQAVDAAERDRPDVVLMDIRLVGSRDGIEAAKEIQVRCGIGSIFVTANTDPHTRHRAQGVQPLAILEKPLTQQRLREAFRFVKQE